MRAWTTYIAIAVPRHFSRKRELIPEVELLKPLINTKYAIEIDGFQSLLIVLALRSWFVEGLARFGET